MIQLERTCTALLEARDPGQYNAALARAAADLDCATFGGFYLVDVAHLPWEEKARHFHNVPADTWDDPHTAGVDPAMQHARTSALPIVWNQHTYTAAGQGGLWERLSRSGQSSGLLIGLHLPGQRHFCLGVESPDRWDGDNERAARLLPAFCTLALYAHAAAQRLFDSVLTARTMPLSPREREALQWVAAGKTAWEIGMIMSVSERTASKHVDAAMRKLNCATRAQAVAQAVTLGWI